MAPFRWFVLAYTLLAIRYLLNIARTAPRRSPRPGTAFGAPEYVNVVLFPRSLEHSGNQIPVPGQRLFTYRTLPGIEVVVRVAVRAAKDVRGVLTNLPVGRSSRKHDAPDPLSGGQLCVAYRTATNSLSAAIRMIRPLTASAMR